MMLAKRTMTNLTAIGLVAAAAVALGACGSGFGSDQIAQVSLASPDNRAISLDEGDGIQHGDVASVLLRSNGERDLEVTSLELVDVPEQVYHVGGESLGECTFDPDAAPTYAQDGNCGSGQGRYCTDTTNSDGTHVCRDGALPDTPISRPSGETVQFEFFLGANSQVSCPEPGDDVPDGLREEYCGKLEIETNAETSDSTFENGNTTLYFQIVDQSQMGEISIDDRSLDFNDLAPGVMAENSFAVDNTGQASLELTGMSISEHTDMIDISPSTPVTIPAGDDNTRTFDVSIDIPEEYDINELADRVFVNIDWDGATGTGETVTLNLNAAPGFGAALAYEPHALSFADSTTQTVTLSNVGTAALSIDGASLESDDSETNLQEAYSATLAYDGDEYDLLADDIPNISAPDDGEESTDVEVTVEYTGSGGETGALAIEHNDLAHFEETTIGLFADQNPGQPEMYTQRQYNYRFGTESQRQFAIYNAGTSEVTGTSVDNPNQEFTIEGVDGESIPPGGILAGTITFSGTDGSQQSETDIEFSFDDASSVILTNVVSPADGSSRTAEIEQTNGDGSVEVGDVASFELAGEDLNDPNTIRWFLVERPDTSSLFPVHEGEDFHLRPDAAGTYTLVATARGGGAPEHQASFELTVE